MELNIGTVVFYEHENHLRKLMERYQGPHCVTKMEIETPLDPDAPIISDEV